MAEDLGCCRRRSAFGCRPTVPAVRFTTRCCSDCVSSECVDNMIMLIGNNYADGFALSIWRPTRTACPLGAERSGWCGQHDDTVFGVRADDGVAQLVFGVRGDLRCERCEFACSASDVSRRTEKLHLYNTIAVFIHSSTSAYLVICCHDTNKWSPIFIVNYIVSCSAETITSFTSNQTIRNTFPCGNIRISIRAVWLSRDTYRSDPYVCMKYVCFIHSWNVFFVCPVVSDWNDRYLSVLIPNVSIR